MKKTNFLSVMTLLAVVFAASGCVNDTCNNTITYRKFTPVYMTESEFVNAVAVEPARAIQRAGKIFTQDGYLFVNEVAQGVHIIDNKNPSSPLNLAFLRVPGNYDIAVHCGYLYLDSSKDLLVFDLANPAAPSLVSRIENALPQFTEFRGWFADASKGIVVEWKEEILTEQVGCDFQVPNAWTLNEITVGAGNVAPSERGINPASPGQAGSMSRFAATDDRLYVVTSTELKVFDASSCTQPSLISSNPLMAGLGETVFYSDEKVFIGSNGGMSIYFETPAGVEFAGLYNHQTACDPVVVQGDFAYVTLSNGLENPCGGWSNQLDVVSIANPRNPFVVRSFPMTQPQGLSVADNRLFLADGPDGIKVFDNTNPERVGANLLLQARDKFGYDVIVNENLVIVTGKDGIAQYRYENSELNLLSTLPIIH